MNNPLLYIALSSSLLALSACSEEVLVQENSNGKTPIELQVGLAQPVGTRATVVTDATANMTAFVQATQLHVAMQSDNMATGATDAMHTMTLATAAAKDGDAAQNTVTIAPVRYWDDAYARNAAVSIYALAVADRNTSSKFTAPWNAATTEQTAGHTESAWETNALGDLGITWTTGTTADGKQVQNATTLADDDLCFSNNIANNGTSADGRLKFKPTATGATTGKFDQGHLVFYHALSEITIEIKAGDGFISTTDKTVSSSFKFNEGTNVQLNGFNATGTFDVKDGAFKTSSIASKTFETIDCSEPQYTDNTQPVYTLRAFVIPGTDLTVTLPNAFSMTVNDNLYNISRQQLFDAIKGNAANLENGEVKASVLDNKTSLKAGVHYKFTFTITKSQVKNLTASVVPWETVEAVETKPTNARIKLDLWNGGEDLSNHTIALYRSRQYDNTSATVNDDYADYHWATGYGSDDKKTYGETLTNWYWDSNREFDHFRAISPEATTITTDATNGDSFTLTAGGDKVGNDNKAIPYTDYLWGAPLSNTVISTNNNKVIYSTTNGFDGSYNGTDASTHQIYKGIGPTEDQIKLTMFHLLSDVTIKVETVNSADEPGAQVTLDGAKVRLQNLYTGGKVLMGNGLVTPTGSQSDIALQNKSISADPNDASKLLNVSWNNYGAIPQSLEDAVLVITSPFGSNTERENEYRVNLKDVWTSSVSTNNMAIPYPAKDGKYNINRWYPGVKYIYTFTLRKKGIEKISATVVDWETVEAGDEVQIK